MMMVMMMMIMMMYNTFCSTHFYYVFRSKNIGLGNGQRKSKGFEDFVLEKRMYLRENSKLCERATQRVLLYSNNFLHKKLKTDPTVRKWKGSDMHLIFLVSPLSLTL